MTGIKSLGRLAVWGFALLLAVALGSPLGAAPPSVPSDGRLEFTIVRNGEAIGTHDYRFTRQGARTTVDIRTRVNYRLLFVPIYRFRHDSREIWEDGKLESLDSKTDDNGEPVQLAVKAKGAALKVQGREGIRELDSSVVPASLWNLSALGEGKLLGTVGGNVLASKAAFVGEESLQVDGKQVRALHYRLSGEFQRDLWYDAANRTLMQVRFKAKDGSTVEYVRRDSSI